MNNSNDNQSRFVKKQRIAEQRLQSTYKKLDNLPDEVSKDIKILIHSLQIHQIELEMQNDELRKAQLIIKDSKKRIFDLYNFAPVGYFTFNKVGKILEMNITGAELLGISKENLMYTSFFDNIVTNDKDIFYLHLTSVMKTNENFHCDLKLKKNDGTEIYVRLNSQQEVSDNDKAPNCRTVLSDISDSKNDELQIKDLLHEKQILLKEVHHRIINNMTIIKALLQMQSNNLNIPVVTEAFQDAISRLDTMLVLYDKLYIHENYQEASVIRYFPILIEEILNTFSIGKFVKTVKNIDDFTLNIKKIFSLGIIINELSTNAMKYAFPDKKEGLIQISILKVKNHVTCIFHDNGIGLPKIKDKGQKGFGLFLVETMVKQLKGSLIMETDNGAKFTIKFDV